MARRKRWKQPNDPTPIAKQVWRACYPDRPWPKGWHVEWVGFMRGAYGLCDRYRRRIVLSHGDAKSNRGHVLQTLIHEFVHVLNPGLKHGIEFDRLTVQACARVGLRVEGWNGSKRGHKSRKQELLAVAA